MTPVDLLRESVRSHAKLTNIDKFPAGLEHINTQLLRLWKILAKKAVLGVQAQEFTIIKCLNSLR